MVKAIANTQIQKTVSVSSSGQVHYVTINDKLYHISQKRLVCRAKSIASRMDTYCSIATKAREEWQSKGFLITKRFFECGSRLIVYYNKDTMWNAIYDYVLHHPEEVVLLDINYRKKVTAKDIELAEAIKNINEINSIK